MIASNDVGTFIFLTKQQFLVCFKDQLSVLTNLQNLYFDEFWLDFKISCQY